LLKVTLTATWLMRLSKTPLWERKGIAD